MNSRRDKGIVAIVAWKFFRAALSVVAAVGLVALRSSGTDVELESALSSVSAHGVHRVSVELATVIASALEGGHFTLVLLGLFLDACVVFLEGLALLRDWKIGPWLVIVATSALVPFEIRALVEHASLTRGAVLAVNVLIVGYLVLRAVQGLRAPRRPVDRRAARE